MTDKKDLIKLLKKGGNMVYVVQKSISKSGMTRKLALYVKNGDYMQMIDAIFCDVTGWRMDKDGYIIVHGCGMDMHFHTVYTLSACLFGYKGQNAYKLKYQSL